MCLWWRTAATVGTLSFLIPSQASSAFASGAISDQIYCFAAGTRIRTERGAVAVEDLREGDRVWSVLGECFEPVQWIGYRQVNCRAHPRPHLVQPVVVSAGAFGPGLPARDLWLSPDHAVFVNDGLIPVKLLENGTTIRQVAVDTVMYYHVELPTHDVVLAEGLAAESYLDVGDRSSFANGGGPVALHPEFAARRWELRWEAEACVPLYVIGPQVEAARALVAVQRLVQPAARSPDGCSGGCARRSHVPRHGLSSGRPLPIRAGDQTGASFRDAGANCRGGSMGRAEGAPEDRLRPATHDWLLVLEATCGLGSPAASRGWRAEARHDAVCSAGSHCPVQTCG